MNNCSSPLTQFSLSSCTSKALAKPVRVTKDVEPTKSLPVSSEKLRSLDDKETNEKKKVYGECLVCKKNEARYRCPQCDLPYCSVECYRNHTTQGQSSDISSHSAERSSSFSCTEVFFKKKVADVMQLESAENTKKTHQLLNRCKNTNYGNENEDDNLYDDEDYYQLLTKLEELEDVNSNGNHHMSPIELSKLLPPSVKAKFEKDLQDGKMHELVLDHWYPWWKHDIVKLNDDEEDKDGEGNSRYSSFPKTLDEKLLNVVSFNELGGKNKNDGISMAINNNDVLLYNLIDILHATCIILRLYHGVQNASQQAPVEAAITLIEISSVLSNDTRFIALSQVLNHCASKSISKASTREPKIANNKDENLLLYIEDVALLLSTHRLVGRALLEASDVLKSASKELKRNAIIDNNNNNKVHNNNNDQIKQIRRLRKKLEFFLSWTQYPTTVEFFSGVVINEDIFAWIAERREIIPDNNHSHNDGYDTGSADYDNQNENEVGGNGLNTMNLPFILPLESNTYKHHGSISGTQQRLIVEVEKS